MDCWLAQDEPAFPDLLIPTRSTLDLARGHELTSTQIVVTTDVDIQRVTAISVASAG